MTSLQDHSISMLGYGVNRVGGTSLAGSDRSSIVAHRPIVKRESDHWMGSRLMLSFAVTNVYEPKVAGASSVINSVELPLQPAQAPRGAKCMSSHLEALLLRSPSIRRSAV